MNGQALPQCEGAILRDDCVAGAQYACLCSTNCRCEAAGEAAGEAIGENFARCVFPDPYMFFTRSPPPESDLIKWYQKPASGMLSGVVFSDGSAVAPGF